MTKSKHKNNGDVKSGWKNFCQHSIAIVMLISLYVALILSIIHKIDGLGVLAIILAILFFIFVLFQKSPTNNDQADPEDEWPSIKPPIEAVVDCVVNEMRSPGISRLLFGLGLRLFGYLANNADRLEDEQRLLLKNKINQLQIKISKSKQAEESSREARPAIKETKHSDEERMKRVSRSSKKNKPKR